LKQRLALPQNVFQSTQHSSLVFSKTCHVLAAFVAFSALTVFLLLTLLGVQFVNCAALVIRDKK
jgi:hypothetical protein